MALAAPFPAASSASRRARPARAQWIPALRPDQTWRGVRLTSRGRALLMLSSAAFLLLAILMSGRFTADAGTSAPASGAPTTIVVVQPGESLWEIATRSQPNADPREVVTTIRALNALGDATIVAGQSILVPGSARSGS